MQYQSFLIKYAEIGTKGKNRFMFEDALIKQIRFALREVDGSFEVTKESGRIYVTAEGDYDYDDTIEALKRVFGIADICPMVQIDDRDYENLKKHVVEYMDKVYPDKNLTFKVVARRGDKRYPVSSDQINRDMGEAILEAFPQMRVDVHNPDVLLRVEIRQKVNIFSLMIPGPGGMPVGTNGKAMLLLSGGIDSPVAAYMMAKRGLSLACVHFASPPYTSERARMKVLTLAKKLTPYTGNLNVYVVPYTAAQEHIRDNAPEDLFTVLMRRSMMRITRVLCEKESADAIVTGESLAQVASQTLKAIACTDAAQSLPVLRPCIGMDKTEITDIARKIDTYETSILPYEDCCTIFTPPHPKTKPHLDEIEAAEAGMPGLAELEAQAAAQAEVVYVNL